MADDGFGCLAMAALLAAGAYFAYDNYFASNKGDYITIYDQTCSPLSTQPKPQTFRQCKDGGGSILISSASYRIDFEHQRVFALGLFPIRYDNCQVADRLNWVCQFNDGSGYVQVGDGQYLRSSNLLTEQTNWLQYQLSGK
ncbi:hypothetical protein [Hyphomicrobium sp. MC1]|uniref:hypothetical protein n=1 Tax=Hyphomicrobium sp. (strain MC1) TaxID=717785 RepID=UPI0012F47B6A|nr:hypothetical protein [Hyphomicrobium sp. MC1]